MDIGDRIKIRRIDLGMTQTELAHVLGYKSKAAISTVENNKEDMTTERIKKYAKALKTTPAYLMGWASDPDPDYQPTLKDHFARATSNIMKAIDTPKDFDEFQDDLQTSEFTEQEIDLIMKFREIDSDLQRMVISSLDTALTMTRERKKEKASSLSQAN